MRKHIFYNTVNFQPVTFRILFFRGIQTLQMRLSPKSMFLPNTTTKALLPGRPNMLSRFDRMIVTAS